MRARRADPTYDMHQRRTSCAVASSMNWISSSSVLCPKRKPAVENSVAMPAFTVGLYPEYSGMAPLPSSATRNSSYVI